MHFKILELKQLNLSFEKKLIGSYFDESFQPFIKLSCQAFTACGLLNAQI